MTVEKRVAAKSQTYEIVDAELEKDKARDAELLAVWKGQGLRRCAQDVEHGHQALTMRLSTRKASG